MRPNQGCASRRRASSFGQRPVDVLLAPRMGEGERTEARRRIEFLPRTFRLGETVGHGVDGRRMMAQPAMAALHLDVLHLRAVLVETRLPGADAIGAAEDRGGR